MPRDRLLYSHDPALSCLVRARAQAESVPFFLSRRYTIGRCLDSVCQHLGIENRNNERGAQKLVLAIPPAAAAAAAASGAAAAASAAAAMAPLPFDIQLSLLESELPSGSALVLTYENASP